MPYVLFGYILPNQNKKEENHLNKDRHKVYKKVALTVKYSKAGTALAKCQLTSFSWDGTNTMI